MNKYIGCKSGLCQQCRHYIKFLTVSTMRDICWNKGCFYEIEDTNTTYSGNPDNNPRKDADIFHAPDVGG